VSCLDVLYLTYLVNPFGEEAGVLHSQVISLLKMVKQIKPELRIGWFAMVSGKRDKAQEENLRKILQGSEVLLEILYLEGVSKWKQLLMCLEHVIKYQKEYAPKVLHCRGYIASLLAIISKQICKAPHVKVIFDPRGVRPEENALNAKGFSRLPGYITSKLIERYLLMKSDFVVCVSQAMIDHFQQIRINANYVCIPTGVDTNVFKYKPVARSKIRATLGLSDNDIVVTYSGGLKAWWHSPNLIATTIIYLSKFIDFHFLLLSRSDIKDSMQFLKKNSFDPNKISTYALHPHEVPAYLSASDFGLLVREKSIVNKVAFPTKFAEYLACGVPVIATPAVSDIAKIIRRYNIGYLLNEATSEGEIGSSILTLLNADVKQRCIEISKKYSIQESAKNYIILYTQN